MDEEGQQGDSDHLIWYQKDSLTRGSPCHGDEVSLNTDYRTDCLE